MTRESDVLPPLNPVRPETAKAVDLLLRKVAWASNRYTDNVGVQFILELEKSGGKEAAYDFINRLTVSQDMFRTPLTEKEREVLETVRGKCNITQQLSDAGVKSNLSRALMSRRSLLRMSTGAAAGWAFGQVVSLINPLNSPEIQEAEELRSELQTRRNALVADEELLQEIANKPEASLTARERDRLVEGMRRRLEFNADTLAEEQRLDALMEPATKTVRKGLDNLEYLTAGLGLALGIKSAVQEEVGNQAKAKLEAVVKTLDNIISYKLGRTIHPLEKEQSIAR